MAPDDLVLIGSLLFALRAVPMTLRSGSNALNGFMPSRDASLPKSDRMLVLFELGVVLESRAVVGISTNVS